MQNMYKIAFLFLVVISLCFGAPDSDEIDSETEYESFYYVASLRSSSNSHFCGGIIITNRTILTAASCLKGRDAESTIAVVGTYWLKSGGVRYQAEKLLIHPKYNESTITNDIAIMILNRTIEFTYIIRPIEIEYNYIDGNVDVCSAGWGTDSYPGVLSNDLQRINLKTGTVQQCKKAHPNIFFESQICTLTDVGKGVCHGDAGGPLVQNSNGKLVGIVSWGIPCAIGKPDVYTRVSSFTNWIDANKI